MRCVWCEGPRGGLIVCDAPRAVGPFCEAHATRGLVRHRVAAGLDPAQVGTDLWPLDERPAAQPKVVTSEQAARMTSAQRGVAKSAQRLRDDAAQRNAVLRQHVTALIAAGVATQRGIADALNQRGVSRHARACGAAWDARAVEALLDRLSIHLGTRRRRQAEPERIAA